MSKSKCEFFFKELYIVFYKTLGKNLTQEINVFRTIKSDPEEGFSNRVDFYCCQIWFIKEKGTFRTFIYGGYFIFSPFLYFLFPL